MIKVNGAWYINAIGNYFVLELEDGTLTKALITPFRKITEKDFSVYKGYHPRKLKGNPVPDYLYKFYGLDRNDETLSEVIRTRVRPSELEELNKYAKNNDITVSELMRELIKELLSNEKS